MEYLNIHSSTVDSEAMQDAEAADVRNWLFLLRYCTGMENSGQIDGARNWSDLKWLKQCGVVKQDVVDKKTTLWTWEGDDLLLEFYPLEQEKILQGKRRAGRKGGKVRHTTPSSSALSTPSSTPSSSASSSHTETGHSASSTLQAEPEGVLQRKVMEGKVKKEESKVREAHTEEGSLSVGDYPTEEEVKAWAGKSAVNVEFAAQKWAETTENHAWVRYGVLIDWRMRFKRYWEEDGEGWLKKRAEKNGAGQPGAPGDWWTEPLESVERALHGAVLLGDEATATEIREILRARRQKDKPKPKEEPGEDQEGV